MKTFAPVDIENVAEGVRIVTAMQKRQDFMALFNEVAMRFYTEQHSDKTARELAEAPVSK